LYFDENFPVPVLDHFRKGSRWKKKVKALSAIDLSNEGKSDEFHFAYCTRNGYTLVTFDEDFNDDAAYPFANGSMPGVVMVKETKGNVQKTADVLSGLLDFVLTTLLPKAFLSESKFTIEGCVMRGRDVRTKEVKSLHIISGHLNDDELETLHAATFDEMKRRGKLPPSGSGPLRRDTLTKRSPKEAKISHNRREDITEASLPSGKVNAVRAAFKAGIRPATIARQFGISQANVKKALASYDPKR